MEQLALDSKAEVAELKKRLSIYGLRAIGQCQSCRKHSTEGRVLAGHLFCTVLLRWIRPSFGCADFADKDEK